MSKIKTETKTKKLKSRLTDYLRDDYRLVKQTDTHYVLVKNHSTAIMHGIILLLTFWTLGLGNIIYHIKCNETVMLKV